MTGPLTDSFRSSLSSFFYVSSRRAHSPTFASLPSTIEHRRERCSAYWCYHIPVSDYLQVALTTNISTFVLGNDYLVRPCKNSLTMLSLLADRAASVFSVPAEAALNTFATLLVVYCCTSIPILLWAVKQFLASFKASQSRPPSALLWACLPASLPPQPVHTSHLMIAMVLCAG